jgi:hypothetical protein
MRTSPVSGSCSTASPGATTWKGGGAARGRGRSAAARALVLSGRSYPVGGRRRGLAAAIGDPAHRAHQRAATGTGVLHGRGGRDVCVLLALVLLERCAARDAARGPPQIDHTALLGRRRGVCSGWGTLPWLWMGPAGWGVLERGRWRGDGLARGGARDRAAAVELERASVTGYRLQQQLHFAPHRRQRHRGENRAHKRRGRRAHGDASAIAPDRDTPRARPHASSPPPSPPPPCARCELPVPPTDILGDPEGDRPAAPARRREPLRPIGCAPPAMRHL